MNRSITLGSSSRFTDLVLLLVAAFIKIIVMSVQFILLLGAALIIKLFRADTDVLEMALLMVICVVIFNILGVLGYL